MSENETKQPSAGEVLRQLSEYTSEPTGLVAMIARSVLGGQDWKTVILLESEWRDVTRSPEAAQLRALLTPQPTPERKALVAEVWWHSNGFAELLAVRGRIRLNDLEALKEDVEENAPGAGGGMVEGLYIVPVGFDCTPPNEDDLSPALDWSRASKAGEAP